jgi:hypothetical protein
VDEERFERGGVERIIEACHAVAALALLEMNREEAELSGVPEHMLPELA